MWSTTCCFIRNNSLHCEYYHNGAQKAVSMTKAVVMQILLTAVIGMSAKPDVTRGGINLEKRICLFVYEVWAVY